MEQSSSLDDVDEIVVYWRPGCGFCSSLLRELDRLDVPYRAVNIWEVPGAADVVRSFARGHETVPTVVMGTLGLVNPSAHDVLAVAAVHAPASVPVGYEPPEPGRFSSWLNSKLH